MTELEVLELLTQKADKEIELLTMIFFMLVMVFGIQIVRLFFKETEIK